jgi:omega-amidase
MIKRYTAAGVQMDIFSRDGKGNLRRAVELTEEAAEGGAKLVCLPELFTTGFDYDYIRQTAGPVPGPLTETLSSLASKLGIFLAAGSIPERKDNELYNCAVLFGPDGNILGSYRKMHLFPLMGETREFCGGDRCDVFDTELGKIGIIICYDLRFPELARKLACAGAELIILPAEFPYPRFDHWRCLLQARAIENQCYVMGVNRVGRHDTTKFFGNTSIYDPWGNLLAGSGDRESLVLGRIDLETVQNIRKKIPVFNDRRPELY